MRPEMTRERAKERQNPAAKYWIKTIQIGCGIVICLIGCYLSLYMIWGSSNSIANETAYKELQMKRYEDPYGQISPDVIKKQTGEINASMDEMIRTETQITEMGLGFLFMGLSLITYFTIILGDIRSHWGY